MEGAHEVQEKPAAAPATPEVIQTQAELTANAIILSNLTANVILRRFGDTNTLPYTHVTLAFVYDMMFYPNAMNRDLAPEFPWKLAAAHLNTIIRSVPPDDATLKRIEGGAFPEVVGDRYESPEAEVAAVGVRRRRPLPEDFAMRGLLWTDKYLPDEYFKYERFDEEDKYFEVASMVEQRRERLLYLGCRIAQVGGGRYLRYENRAFLAGPEYDIELEVLPETVRKKTLMLFLDRALKLAFDRRNGEQCSGMDYWGPNE